MLNFPQVLAEQTHTPSSSIMDPREAAISIDEAQGTTTAPLEEAEVSSLPFVFSAKTQASLKAMLGNMLTMLDDTNNDMALLDIAPTLLTERSVLPFRRALTGATKPALRHALQAALADNLATTDFSTEAPTHTTHITHKPRVLGIFTGQGEQWPGMLKALLQKIPSVRGWIRELDASLRELPDKYRPA